MAFDSSEVAGARSDAAAVPSFLRGLATLSGMALLVLGAGYVRTAATAAVYGVTPEKDAFDIAARVPQWLLFLFGLDLLRALGGAIFARLDARKDEDPSEVFSSLMTVLVVVGGVGVAAGMVWTGPLVKLLGPGLDAEREALCRSLLRILLPSMVLGAGLGLLSSVLNAHHRYVLAELGNLLLRVFVFVAVVTAGWFFRIHLLAVAMLVGLSLAVAVQWVHVRRLGYRFRPRLHLRSRYVREAGRGMLPLLLAMVVGQTGDLYFNRLLSYGEAGTVASYTYATMIYGLAVALLLRPLMQVFAPRIGRRAEMGEIAEGRELFGRTLRVACILGGAATVVVATCCESLVAILFRRGRFDQAAVAMTGGFLAVLIWAAVGQGVGLVCTPSFYAFGRGWRFFAAIVCRDGLRIPLAAVGFAWFGPMIVPAAVAAGAVAEGLAGVVLVRRLLGGLGTGWGRWVLQYVATVGLGGLVSYLLAGAWPYAAGGSFWYHAGRVAAVGVGGVGTMFLAGLAVRMGEVQELARRMIAGGWGMWKRARA